MNIFGEIQSMSVFLQVFFFFFNKDTHKVVPPFVCIYAFSKSKHLASWKLFIMENHLLLKQQLTVYKYVPFEFSCADINVFQSNWIKHLELHTG